MSEILWTKAAFVGLLLWAGDLRRLPAQAWPLEAAIELLVENAPKRSDLQKAAREWSMDEPTPNGRIAGLRPWLRQGVETRLLTPEGIGWDAAYLVDEAWIEGCGRLAKALSDPEREALMSAAQRMVAMATMVSKKSAA